MSVRRRKIKARLERVRKWEQMMIDGKANLEAVVQSLMDAHPEIDWTKPILKTSDPRAGLILQNVDI